jgi:hypothetical protein
MGETLSTLLGMEWEFDINPGALWPYANENEKGIFGSSLKGYITHDPLIQDETISSQLFPFSIACPNLTTHPDIKTRDNAFSSTATLAASSIT